MMQARNVLARNDRGSTANHDLGQIRPSPTTFRRLPKEPFWANYWLILHKRKWVALATLVIVTALATIVTLPHNTRL
jgi:hypothetical protein